MADHSRPEDQKSAQDWRLLHVRARHHQHDFLLGEIHHYSNSFCGLLAFWPGWYVTSPSQMVSC